MEKHTENLGETLVKPKKKQARTWDKNRGTTLEKNKEKTRGARGVKPVVKTRSPNPSKPIQPGKTRFA